MDTDIPDNVELLVQLEEFQALDEEARTFVLKVLTHTATDADHEAFRQRPDAQQIARWMMTLPAFRRAAEARQEWDGENE